MRINKSLMVSIMKVVIFLGPYRNLTTLWSAVFASHPQAIVLNHSTPQLDEQVSSIVESKYDYSEVLQCLLAAVGQEYKTIENSHALRIDTADPKLRSLYCKWSPLQQSPSHIIWKDSGRLTKEFRVRPGSLQKFILAYPQIQFLFPLRNPLDVVISNVDKDLYLDAYDYSGTGYYEFADWYIDVFNWFLEWRRQEPRRFSHLATPTQKTLSQTLGWLGLPVFIDWIRDTVEAFDVKETNYSNPKLASYLKQNLKCSVNL